MKIEYITNPKTISFQSESQDEIYQIGQLSIKFPKAQVCTMGNTKVIDLDIDDILRELTNRANGKT